MSSGRFGDSGMMPAAVGQVSNGMGYTQSHDAYTQAMMDYFGGPGPQTRVQSYQLFPSTNQTLPDAYDGVSLLLNDTVEGLILQDNEVYTEILLRWLLTDQIHFKYKTFVFNQTLPSLVPHEGVSNLITSSSESREFTSQRRGLAFRMEGDFAGTPQGDAQYTRNLIQISQACQEMAVSDFYFLQAAFAFFSTLTLDLWRINVELCRGDGVAELQELPARVECAVP